MFNWLVRAVVSTVLSYVGWWAGAFISTMTAFILSTILAGVGIWLGGKVARNMLG